jgi:RES domain-containing protein
MHLFRIAKTEFIRDVSGAGSRVHGGRWNRKGTALVYTSESRALAALEYLVHVPMALAPAGLSILRIDVPDDTEVKTVDATSLPRNWKAYPPPQNLAAIGTGWALSNETLLLRVPSVVVEDEFNYLINPSHPEFKRIRPHRPQRFALDQRLLKQKERK